MSFDTHHACVTRQRIAHMRIWLGPDRLQPPLPIDGYILGQSNKHVCREQAQKHYQKLTRELTQGQLLRLGHRQSFVQQASFVLLRGHVVVKGQAAGGRLASLFQQL